MVFGLFVRLAGLVALGSLHTHTLARTVVWPGVAIALAAIVVNGISAGYYMHMGFWGADQLKGATEAGKAAFLDNIRPGSERMICLERMAKMFFSRAHGARGGTRAGQGRSPLAGGGGGGDRYGVNDGFDGHAVQPCGVSPVRYRHRRLAGGAGGADQPGGRAGTGLERNTPSSSGLHWDGR
jgi:hypothetical protein